MKSSTNNALPQGITAPLGFFTAIASNAFHRLRARRSLSSRCSVVVLLVGALIGTLGSVTATADVNTIRYINDWKWEGQAAPMLLALDKGYFDDEHLTVTLEPGTGSVAAIPRVAAGEFEFGSADINSLISWRAENPDTDLKAIFIIYNAPPFAVIGRPSQGVFGPLDLEGHTLGAPAGDGAFAQWPAFVRANGILADKVTIEDVGFPVREPMLANGDVDAITGFSFSSMVGLEEQGVPAEDLSLMLMSDFGLDLYGNAIIVNPEFAADNPDVVKAFLRASIRGFQETIRFPAAAVKHVTDRLPDAQGDEQIETRELRRLVMAIGHHIATDEVRQIGLGAIVEPRLEKSIAQLAAISDFDKTPSVGDIFDASYLPELGLRLLPTGDEAMPVPPPPTLEQLANQPGDESAEPSSDTDMTAPETGAQSDGN